MRMLSLLGSMLLLEVKLKGCHWSLDSMGTFTDTVLVGV